MELIGTLALFGACAEDCPPGPKMLTSSHEPGLEVILTYVNWPGLFMAIQVTPTCLVINLDHSFAFGGWGSRFQELSSQTWWVLFWNI